MASGISLQEGEPSTSAAQRHGIPVAEFVEDVESFLAGKDARAATLMLEERLQQYKLLEVRLLAQRRDLQGKLPDIKRCLEIVQVLQAKEGKGEETKVDFEVAEGTYAQATIRDVRSVCLWLGANVMVEYPFEEAASLLEKNLANAGKSLQGLVSSLEFLRDQSNVTEVTIARIHNWDVAQRRKRKEQAQQEDELMAESSLAS